MLVEVMPVVVTVMVVNTIVPFFPAVGLWKRYLSRWTCPVGSRLKA